MKIATWNVERLRHFDSLGEIKAICNRLDADVLVLTETDSRICPNLPYSFHTLPAIGAIPKLYQPTENRVSIYTKYKCVREHRTCDGYTALCVELETDRGNLMVYGTIFGIFGNRHKSFQKDLEEQMKDIHRFAGDGKSICACGDYNCSFLDDYYFTKKGRATISDCFDECDITILTADRAECIDHIAISNDFVGPGSITVNEWNYDKKLSDHKGIMVEF